MSFPPALFEPGLDRDVETFRDELIDAAERGPAAVEAVVGAWSARRPGQADAFRKEARAVVLLWGLREPDRLGQYQLLDVLTTGGMGKIYRAREDVTGRIVVVKTARAGRLSQAEQVARFDTERRLLSRLHDSHIVPLLATGQDGDLPYLVMPFIPGVTIRALIEAGAQPGTEPGTSPTFETFFAAATQVESDWRRVGSSAVSAPGRCPGRVDSRGSRRPPDYLRRVVSLMRQVALAVEHIHRAGILHRDIKPSNIMVEASGHAWLIDIGVGREMARGDGDTTTPSGEFARDMTQGVGTLPYMSPEQLPDRLIPPGVGRPRVQDARTDVFGLGATLHELIALRPPFEGATEAELAGAILAPPPALPKLPEEPFAGELGAICRKALAGDPDDRYDSAAAFAADLGRWLDGVPTVAGRAGGLRRIRMFARRRPAGATAIATTLALAFTSIFGMSQILKTKRAEAATARAEAAVAHAEAIAATAQTREAEREVRAKQRDLDLLELPLARAPIRRMGWSEKVSERVRSIRGDDGGPAPELQGQIVAAMEGVDASVVKEVAGMSRSLAFDPRSGRLLAVRRAGPREAPWTRTTLWDRQADRVLAERELGDGAVAFRPDGTPLQLSRDPGDAARLLLHEVESGRVLQAMRSPLDGPSAFAALAFSRDAARAAGVAARTRPGEAIGEAATTIVAWDTAFGRLIRAIEHKATVGLILSPDGRLIAASDASGEIAVWTLPDGKELARFRVGRAAVSCMAFGRDPAWREHDPAPPWLLAVAESSALITVCELRPDGRRTACRGAEFAVDAMDFSDDGSLLLSAGRFPAKLWDVATGTCLLDLNHGDGIESVAFASDGVHVAMGCQSGSLTSGPSVTVLELERGRGIRTLRGLRGVAEKSAISPDGRLIAAASHEWEIGVWERESGRLLHVLPAPLGRFIDSLGLAFDATGRRLACSAGREARLWDFKERRTIRTWALPEGNCDSIAFSGENRLMLARQETKARVGGPDSDYPPDRFPRTARVYELLGSGARPIAEIDDFNHHIHDIEIVADGSLIGIEGLVMQGGERRRGFRLYEGASGRLLGEVATRRPLRDGAYFRFDPGGRFLSIPLGTDFTETTLFSLPGLGPGGMTAARVAALGPVATRSIGYLDGPQPAVGLFDVATGRRQMTMALDVGARPISFQFSPDDRHVVMGRRDGSVSVLDLAEINRRLTRLRLGW